MKKKRNKIYRLSVQGVYWTTDAKLFSTSKWFSNQNIFFDLEEKQNWIKAAFIQNEKGLHVL